METLVEHGQWSALDRYSQQPIPLSKGKLLSGPFGRLCVIYLLTGGGRCRYLSCCLLTTPHDIITATSCPVSGWSR